MKYNKEFTIPFVQLSPGAHYFDFQINNRFFKSIDVSPIKKGNLDVKLVFNKQQENLFVLNFTIAGTVEVECDKCLDNFDLPVYNEPTIFIKVSGKNKAQTDSLLTISSSQTEINVAQLIYEYIILSIPIKHVHPANEKGESVCNPKMIEILNNNTNNNNNNENDPRWDVLKDIIIN